MLGLWSKLWCHLFPWYCPVTPKTNLYCKVPNTTNTSIFMGGLYLKRQVEYFMGHIKNACKDTGGNGFDKKSHETAYMHMATKLQSPACKWTMQKKKKKKNQIFLQSFTSQFAFSCCGTPQKISRHQNQNWYANRDSLKMPHLYIN